MVAASDQAFAPPEVKVDIIRFEDGIAEVKAFDDAGFQAGGPGDLEAVADFERAIQQERNASDEVAEGVLGGQAEHHGGNADTGQPGRAQTGEGRNEVRVRNEGKKTDADLGQLGQEVDGGAVHVAVLIAGEDALDGKA